MVGLGGTALPIALELLSPNGCNWSKCRTDVPQTISQPLPLQTATGWNQDRVRGPQTTPSLPGEKATGRIAKQCLMCTYDTFLCPQTLCVTLARMLFHQSKRQQSQLLLGGLAHLSLSLPSESEPNSYEVTMT